MVGDASLDIASDLPHGHYTHEKNPFTCLAALTVLEVFESEAAHQQSPFRRQEGRPLRARWNR